MNLGLENKVVLITGASKGLGYATAKKLAEEGARVVISSGNEQNIREATISIQSTIENPDKISGHVLDLSTTEHIQDFIDEQASKHNGIDILITNTAGPQSGLFENLSLEDIVAGFQQLFAPTYELIKCASQHMKQSNHPSVLSIASISAKQPVPGLLISNIFRPTITALNKTLSQELGPLGIRVNSILPGWISTNRSKELLESKHSKLSKEDIEKSIPLKRIGTPEEFANAATFLVSPAASYINGIMLPVDGGLISSLG